MFLTKIPTLKCPQNAWWLVLKSVLCFLVLTHIFLWELVSIIVSNIKIIDGRRKGESLGSGGFLGGFLGGFPNQNLGTGVTLRFLIETIVVQRIPSAKEWQLDQIQCKRQAWRNWESVAVIHQKKFSWHLEAWKMQRKHCHWVSEHAWGHCWSKKQAKLSLLLLGLHGKGFLIFC